MRRTNQKGFRWCQSDEEGGPYFLLKNPSGVLPKVSVMVTVVVVFSALPPVLVAVPESRGTLAI